MPAPVSVVIPTLDAATELPAAAAALVEGVTAGLLREMVVSDGGSGDATLRIAASLGAEIVNGAPGRGGQIARGVDAAAGDWLLLLHADTVLSPGWSGPAAAHVARGADRAGYFRLAFDARGAAPAAVAAGANLRARWLGLPYGDQGLLIHRELLARAGGVPDLPLMEDVALARALRDRLRPLEATAVTSAARYLRDGWGRRVARNLWTLARWQAGVPAERLARDYRG